MIRILMVAAFAALLGACSVTSNGPGRDPAGTSAGNSEGSIGE